MIWSILGIAAILLAVAGTSFLIGHGKGYDKARERYHRPSGLYATPETWKRVTESARLRESAESVASSPGSAHEGALASQDRGGKAGQNYSKGFASADPELRESGPLVTDPNDRP